MDLEHDETHPPAAPAPVRPGLRARLRQRAVRLLRRWVKTPEISVTGLKLRQMSLMEQRGQLAIRLHNPNRIALGVRAFRYRVEMSGQRFAKGQTAEPFRIPARDATSFDVDVRLSMLKLAGSLVGALLAPRPTLEYRITGEIELALPWLPPIPFSYTGQVDLERLGERR
jgi:LEA14-like dessication related protein